MESTSRTRRKFERNRSRGNLHSLADPEPGVAVAAAARVHHRFVRQNRRAHRAHQRRRRPGPTHQPGRGRMRPILHANKPHQNG